MNGLDLLDGTASNSTASNSTALNGTASKGTVSKGTAAGGAAADTVGLHARFLRGLAASPDRAAVRLGPVELTYRELHERALLWAGALLKAALEPPAAVGVLAGKSPQAYTGILAALYSGASAVPLNPSFPAERTRRMLALSRVTALIADDEGREAWARIAADDPDLRDLPVLDPAALDPADALPAPRAADPHAPAYILFTSGSTGVPKGVPVSHASTLHYFDLLDTRYDFGPEDVFSQTFDLNFDCAIFDLFCAWGAGATVQAVPPDAYRDLPGFLARSGVTVWFSTPSAITLVRKLGGLAAGALPALRWSFFAGEALRAADAADWQQAADRSTVVNIYGPTELTITVSEYRWDAAHSPAHCVNGVVPIGLVHPGHDYLLLGPDDAACATEGELCIAGPQLTRGYLDPEHDRGRFLDRDSLRYYRTGDRVRDLGGGCLAYLGRLDSQVQIQGWRVELAEVEHAARSCAGVRDAVAVTRDAAGVTELVIFYTGEPIPPARLARALREVLPAGMLPRDVRHLDQFPLNSNRKIDRARLAQAAAARD